MTKYNAGVLRAFSLTMTIALIIGLYQPNTVRAQDADYHYQGQVNINPDTGHLSAKWWITILNQRMVEANFVIRDTASVPALDGDLADWSMMPTGTIPGMHGVIVTLPPSNNGQDRQFTIQYEGNIFATPVDHNINEISPNRIELNIDGFWLPFDISAQRKLTAIVEFTIAGDNASEWRAVSTGETRYENGKIIIHNTRPALDIAVAMSPAFRVTTGEGFSIYDLRPTAERTEDLVASAKICTDFLNAEYGAYDRLPEGRFILGEREEGGYARQNMISFSSITKGDRYGLTEFVCHELAHFWSSNGNFQTVENWLNEGFAVFVGAIAVRATYGDAQYQNTRQSWQDAIQGKDLPPVWIDGDTERKPFLVNYRKSALALADLEDSIGPELMTEFVRTYMTKGIATTPELLDALERIAGTDARSHFASLLAR